jgi:hypothetical protein
MGFLVASSALSAEDLTKLGVRDHPHTSALIERVCKNPPVDESTAGTWFGLMAGLVTGEFSVILPPLLPMFTILMYVIEFTPAQLITLSQSPIVPVRVIATTDGKTAPVRHLPPRQCYFRSKADPAQQLHSKLFTFVDFGLKANQFLSACGTKREPTVEEVACILLEDPRRFWDSAGGKERCVFHLLYC